MTPRHAEASVVGAGPNGLAAAITLARAGVRVRVFERADRAGGGLRTEALTRPGFLHDTCSSVYPLGVASPFLRTIALAERGARWIQPPIALAHPLDDGGAVSLLKSVAATSAELGADGASYRRLFEPLADHWAALVDDILAPLHLPRHPLLLARFGVDALRPAAGLARSRFGGVRARALLAGLAAHSVLPLDEAPSASVGLVLGAAAHAVGWPFVEGGAGRLADALVAELAALGGELVTGHTVHSLDEAAVGAGDSRRVVLCDVSPRQLAALAGSRLPASYRRALARFRYGPGVFKIDWALAEPIPWRAAECRQAGTVHVGGTLEEIAAAEGAAARGEVPARPFVLVTQPTVVDPSRAPAGRHVAWGYCHVPHGATVDMTEAIEGQMERYAPGFRDVVLARHCAGPADLEGRNPNLVGGDVGGGALTLGQLFTRPTWRGYRTPVPWLFLCSASTPPGGAVHGMCGYHAARAALRR